MNNDDNGKSAERELKMPTAQNNNTKQKQKQPRKKKTKMIKKYVLLKCIVGTKVK